MGGDVMTFPDTWEEYEECYGFNDKEQIYTNGSRLIQSYRVAQWLEHIENAPAIVHCKDCRYRQEDVGMGDYKWCDIVSGSRCSDDFCSYAERKE